MSLLVIFIWLISSINKAKPTKNAEHLAYLKARHGDEYDYILTKSMDQIAGTTAR